MYSKTRTYIQKIDGRWYAYAASEKDHQVYAIGSDSLLRADGWLQVGQIRE